MIVLAYAIMSNHFHIFIYVPGPEDIGDEEILRRINALYREASLAQVLGEWTRLKDEEAKLLEYSRPTGKYVSRFGEYRGSFLRRMWNSSEFMRTYKQHFTMSFNARRDHHGTMFEGRYHERNHKPEKPVMWRTAAYVDINAWSAGIVKKAEDYEWCSFAAAVKGDEKARRGYAFIYGNGDWETIRACHEKSDARDEGPRRFVRSKGSVAFEGGSGDQGAEGLFCRAGARQSGGRREDLGTAGGGRSDEAVGASQGRRHSQQHPFQSLLPFPVAGEGHHCSN